MTIGALGGLLTKKVTFLFNIEAQPGVNPGLDPETNAVEVSEPEFTTDVTLLERNFVANDLSPFEDSVGRIVAGFKVVTEVRSNGRAQSGNLADRPILADMIRACGFELYAMTATGTDCHSPVLPDPSNAKTSPTVAWTSTNAATSNKAPVLYTIEVTTGGASGAAKVTVTSNSDAEAVGTMGDVIAAPAEVTLTSGTPLPLGAKGGTLTPAWTGVLTVGQKWSVCVFPRGIKAKPISDNFKTGAMAMNYDGVEHEGLRGLGSFQIDSTAGQIAKITFNYTTTFLQPGDDAIPEVDFGDLPLAPQVELSTFTWGGNSGLVVEKWTYDQANQIEVRPSVNHRQGYAGSRITGRAPKVGFNPEMTHEADHPFWDEFTKAKSKVLLTRIGTEEGNQVVFFMGKVQTSEQPYGDRSGIRTYEKSGGAKRIKGNDEIIIVFC